MGRHYLDVTHDQLVRQLGCLRLNGLIVDQMSGVLGVVRGII